MTSVIIVHLKDEVNNLENRLKAFVRRYNVMFGVNKGEKDERILLMDKTIGDSNNLITVCWQLFNDLPGEDIEYLIKLKDIKPECNPINRVIIITDHKLPNRSLYYDLLSSRIAPDIVRFFFIDEDNVL